MVHNDSGVFANRGNHSGMITGAMEGGGAGVQARRVRMLTCILAGIACWLPFLGLAYLIFR